MYFVSFIEETNVILRILKHLGLLGKDPTENSGLDPPEQKVGF